VILAARLVVRDLILGAAATIISTFKSRRFRGQVEKRQERGLYVYDTDAARLSLSGTNRSHSSTTDFSGSMRNAHISAPVSRTPAEMKNGVIHIPL
jgi:hypothetical protein